MEQLYINKCDEIKKVSKKNFGIGGGGRQGKSLSKSSRMI